MNQVIENLNAKTMQERLKALEQIAQMLKDGKMKKPVFGNDVNNHIHTIYSFSPYSPAKAVYMAYMAGLTTAGIMDHDSVSGAKEFIEAGKILNMATTVGFECRVNVKNSSLNGRRINNPDQKSIIYMALHGIPHTQIEECRTFIKPFLEKRIQRDRAMVDKINKLTSKTGIYIDFEQDVLPLSMAHEGGSVTERHILYALGIKLIKHFSKGTALVTFLKEGLQISISPKIEAYLSDDENPYYDYDLLGALKSDLVSKIYIDADDECPDIHEVINFADRIGAISAYAYLGDIEESVTGDKKAQKFEDDYLDELFEFLVHTGFRAVTYMPSRNTLKQLNRVKGFCDKFGLLQISGEDINSPRQPFVCDALKNPEFHNLIDSTWALIGHEQSATDDLKTAFFANETIESYPNLQDRIKIYKTIGKTKFI